MHSNFDSSSSKLVSFRAEWFAKWTERAKQLSSQEELLKRDFPAHMQNILRPKRLLLLREILLDLEYPDMGVCDELQGGTALVGEVPPFGIFEKTFKRQKQQLNIWREHPNR